MVLICLFDLWGELSPGIHNCEATPLKKKLGGVYYCGPNIIPKMLDDGYHDVRFLLQVVILYDIDWYCMMMYL